MINSIYQIVQTESKISQELKWTYSLDCLSVSVLQHGKEAAAGAEEEEEETLYVVIVPFYSKLKRYSEVGLWNQISKLFQVSDGKQEKGHQIIKAEQKCMYLSSFKPQ